MATWTGEPPKTFNNYGVEERCRSGLILAFFLSVVHCKCLECAERQADSKQTALTSTEKSLVLVVLTLALPVSEE